MTEEIFRCLLGGFNIKDAFEVVDLLFDNGYTSVSCYEKSSHWMVEILNTQLIQESEIYAVIGNYNFPKIKIEKLQKTDWLKKSFTNLKSIIVGDFYIYGPHLRHEPIPTDKIAIEIAAATAFGSGEHPTTKRCLLACQTFFDEKKHKAVLDIGCGSCILSIALAKLGARCIDAYDNDTEAVRISIENIAINKVAHQINVFQNQRCEFSKKKYDFIVANILTDPLISMGKAIASSISRDGILVLSGFTSDDDNVLQKYRSLGLKLKFKYDYKGWGTLVFMKN
ncbi:MAG: 50S ribosomal protein L11 methyltransferase [Holosporaceae bacterium]|jgi:ribosomal protein L11 methyltransferase|nr:50S ribosomal protein L11 methyltransferase [Holosporaceae bacterium]